MPQGFSPHRMEMRIKQGSGFGELAKETASYRATYGERKDERKRCSAQHIRKHVLASFQMTVNKGHSSLLTAKQVASVDTLVEA